MDNTQLAMRQMQAWIAAHRVLLTYLMRVVRALPGEGTRDAVTATEIMLRQSIPQMFERWPEDARTQAIALAEQELDRILTAPFLDAPPAPPDR